MNDGIVIQPFNSDDDSTAPAFWIAEPEFRVLSKGQLLERFYTEFDPTDPPGNKPIAFVYNPEIDGVRVGSFNGDQIVVVAYRKNYRVFIEKNWRYISGPHAALLYYQPWQVEGIVWVATCQVEGMFYNEETIREALTTCILQHEFYHSPKSSAEIIII